MQMIGIQFSWYGAGFIDWMTRGQKGNFIFVHRMRNSNVNTEAFMRTGNRALRSNPRRSRWKIDRKHN